jgi:hypothetical protein
MDRLAGKVAIITGGAESARIAYAFSEGAILSMTCLLRRSVAAKT